MFTIIRKRTLQRYQDLFAAQRALTARAFRHAQLLEEDCEELRGQLSSSMDELRKLRRKRYNTPKDIFIDNGSCTGCPHEPTDCKKYHIGKHTICQLA